jgi:hypothetical protein
VALFGQHKLDWHEFSFQARGRQRLGFDARVRPGGFG